MTHNNEPLGKFALIGIAAAAVLIITAIVIILRILLFSTTYNAYGYVEYPMFNAIPPIAIAFCIRGILSPRKRSIGVSILAFFILLATGIVQEYIVARHMALVMGVDPAAAPLLPTLAQYLAVMAGNVRGISFVLIGVFAGTLLTLVISSFQPQTSPQH